jgi:hypothetical protein
MRHEQLTKPALEPGSVDMPARAVIMPVAVRAVVAVVVGVLLQVMTGAVVFAPSGFRRPGRVRGGYVIRP